VANFITGGHGCNVVESGRNKGEIGESSRNYRRIKLSLDLGRSYMIIPVTNYGYKVMREKNT